MRHDLRSRPPALILPELNVAFAVRLCIVGQELALSITRIDDLSAAATTGASLHVASPAMPISDLLRFVDEDLAIRGFLDVAQHRGEQAPQRALDMGAGEDGLGASEQRSVL